MKNKASKAKKHRCIITALSTAMAFVMFIFSFAAAVFALEGGESSAGRSSLFALCVSDRFWEKNSIEEEGTLEAEETAQDAPLEIIINGTVQNISAKERAGEILVNLSEFLSVCRPTCTVSSGAEFEASDEGLTLSVCTDENFIIANGRYLWCNGGIECEGSEIFVPASVAARIICADNETHSKISSFSLNDGRDYIEDGAYFYNDEDVYWLSRIICAESRGEVMEGKIAVGNVVLNRVLSNEYPNTIYDVIFDSSSGIQFSPAASGAIYNEPSSESIIAAKLCLEGVSVSNEILYFLNPDTAENFWITNNRTYITTIGNHAFYS